MSNKQLTEAEITEWWGERCPDFEPGCATCRAWARHDMIAVILDEDEVTRAEMERDRDDN